MYVLRRYIPFIPGSTDMAAVRRMYAQYSADGLDRDLGWRGVAMLVH
jgi:hypothetical protein